ncbi:glycine-rich protein [Thalictrum thalictroides]|uniref:Glycine-rich protein n=1 Tax=Thalictrum thalictroides TaxID=46969 RepID=A0A7J6VP25_THATH|nr:glycine-rich protein [Thalictrum thalictroides]
MSCMQIITYGPHVKVRNISSSHHISYSQLCICPTYLMTSTRLASNVSSYRRCNTVCLFGGERKAGDGNEASPWKSIEQAMQGFRKERSVQDMLREEMQKREFGDGFGGGAGSPPGGGRGGGGSGGGAEDEGMGEVFDEVLQVVLATLGFMFLYYYILQGQELTRLFKDVIKYLFTRKTSIRLGRTMDQWKAFYWHITRKKRVVQYDWLEREIVNTPTWWHNPARVKRELGHRLASGYYDK